MEEIVEQLKIISTKIGNLSNVADLIISLIALLISIGVFVIYFIQTSTMKKQLQNTIKEFKNNHENSKRENSISIMLEWTKSLDIKTSLATKLANTLPNDLLEKLKDQEAFTITDEKQKELCKRILNQPDNWNGQVNIEQSSEIRWMLMHYLNMLEVVGAAINEKTVDDELVDIEFKYLFKDTKFTLTNFRAFYKGSFPCIDKMEEKYTKANETKAPERKDICN